MDFDVAFPMPFPMALPLPLPLPLRGAGSAGLAGAGAGDLARDLPALGGFLDVRAARAGRCQFFRQFLAPLVLTLKLSAAIGGLGNGVASARNNGGCDQQCKTNGPHRLRRPPLVGAVERRGDLAHEAVHLVFDLHMRLEPHVEVEDDLGKACGLDLFESVGDLGGGP